MSLSMPPCFDCGVKLERRNVCHATKEEMESNPDYDFCKGTDESGIVSLCDNCDQKRYEKENKEKMLKNEIEKHQNFIKEVKDYIKDCLKNETNPAAILESFSKIIDETVNEVLKEKTANA